MKRSVRLSLKKETLTSLASDEMTLVGGAPPHTLEVRCYIVIAEVSLDLTNCCQGIPTFHGAAC